MTEPAEKSEKHPKSSLKPSFTLLIIMVVVVLLGYKVARDPVAAWSAFCNIAIVVLGFGAVIFVHELGHFIAAKSVGILVEGFSLGFGPIVISFKKVQGGLQVRILPSLIPGRHGRGALRAVIPLPWRQDGDTEYRINLIPLGGFVKMLGQEDVAADKPSDDPRAFGNKAVWQRSIVIAAGVTMNVICGAVVFMIVFAKGYAMPPAVAGDVAPLRPAALAGIRPGDVITAVNGNKPFGFLDVFIAAAFTDEDEKVNLTVSHPDGSVETLALMPEKDDSSGIKVFGIEKPYTLSIAKVEEAGVLKEMEKIGIKPGDKIIAVNGEPVSHYYQLSEVLYPLPGVNPGEIVTLTIERTDQSGEIIRQPVEIPMRLSIVEPRQKTLAAIITHIMGMVPRLQADSVSPDGPGAAAGLEPNDVILRIGTSPHPTLEELKDYCKEHVDQKIELLVQRTENSQVIEKILEVTPRREKQSLWARLWNKPNVIIGFYPRLDPDAPIVAAFYSDAVNKYPELSSLPRGALITAVAGEPVENWRQIMDRLDQNLGRTVQLAYRAAPDQPEKTISLNMTDKFLWAGFAYRPDWGRLIDLPLEPHTELFKGDSWWQNLRMGVNQSYSFLAQTYLFIRGMIKGTVKASAASGPVGIFKMSYTVAETRNLSDFLYFMALISICVAAFNFLPIPVLDGGHFLMLLIEKLKGSPVSIRVQEIVSYAGLMLIIGFVIFVTYNDILKIIAGQL